MIRLVGDPLSITVPLERAGGRAKCHFRAVYTDLGEEAQKALTCHYGEFGERIDVPVTIMQKKVIETGSPFGDITLAKAFTVDGSELVWFTGCGTYDYKPGEVYGCRAR